MTNFDRLVSLYENQNKFLFPIHFMNEQELEKGLKEAYQLYSRLEFEPFDPDSDPDEDEEVNDRYSRYDDEDPNKHLTFERFKEENLGAIRVMVYDILAMSYRYYYPRMDRARDIGSGFVILDVYVNFVPRPQGGMHYDILILFEDKNKEKWVIIDDAFFDSREGHEPRVSNGHLLAKMDRKEFSIDFLPFELKNFRKIKGEEAQALLQKALKRKLKEKLSPLSQKKQEELDMDLENIEKEEY